MVPGVMGVAMFKQDVLVRARCPWVLTATRCPCSRLLLYNLGYSELDAYRADCSAEKESRIGLSET